MFKDFAVPEVQSTGDIVRTKIKVGANITGVLVGEPCAKYTHWEGDYPNSVYLGVCTGASCPFCQEGNKPNYTFQQNFLTLDATGTPIMTILEGPRSLAAALAKKEGMKGEDFFINTVINIDRSDKTAFTIEDIKPPKGLDNVEGILKEAKTFDLEGMTKAIADKQAKVLDTDETAPF